MSDQKPAYPQMRKIEGRWGWNPTGRGRPNEQQALEEMCNYGAKEFNEGRCDHVNFELVGCEVEEVKAYMAKAHPKVPYTIMGHGACLQIARANWAKKYGKP